MQSLSNCIPLESLLNILQKMFWQRQCLLLPFSGYCSLQVGRYCDPPSGEHGAERLKLQYKTKKNIENLLNLFGKWLTSKLRRFWVVFNFFWFCLTLSVTEKLKNSISEMPIITQTLNINNVRTTIAKSINLHTIRKFAEYSLKHVLAKAMFTLTVFEILLSEG